MSVLASREILHVAAGAKLHPVAWMAYLGSLVVVLAKRCPMAAAGRSPARWQQRRLGRLGGWPGPACGLHRGDLPLPAPGGDLANLAVTVFIMIYVGLMLSFLLRLRLAWGVPALVTLIFVVKMGDAGAYAVGRLIGRHKIAPVLSPGKTIEEPLGPWPRPALPLGSPLAGCQGFSR